MKKYKKVAVGGTFDKFHYGHRKLLKEAFNQGEKIVIGVTSEGFASKKGNIDPCNERINNLKEFLSDKYANFNISKLDDKFGSTIYEEDFDAIIVSEETEPTAMEINKIRHGKNMTPVDIIVISFVFADDGIPISSTRIRQGKIDIKGHVLDEPK